MDKLYKKEVILNVLMITFWDNSSKVDIPSDGNVASQGVFTENNN